MAPKKPNPKQQSYSPESAAQAYQSVLAEIEAVPDDALRPIIVDIPMACALGLGAAELIGPLRAEITALPGIEVASVAKLRTYALAALFANAVYTNSLNDQAFKKVLEEAGPLREALLVGAEALAHRGLLPVSRVAEIRAGQGHQDTADDLIALAALFREAWPKIQGKTAVVREEFERAAILGSELHAAVGARRVGGGGSTGSQELWKARHRAFTLFLRAYDECRRGVQYLRWHAGDADRYMPSLYRKGRRSAPVADDEVEDEGEPADELGEGLDDDGIDDDAQNASPVPVQVPLVDGSSTSGGTQETV